MACDFSHAEPSVFATGDNFGNVLLHDTGNLAAPVWMWQAHKSTVNGIDFLKTGPNVFATCGKDGNIHIFDRRTDPRMGSWMCPSGKSLNLQSLCS